MLSAIASAGGGAVFTGGGGGEEEESSGAGGRRGRKRGLFSHDAHPVRFFSIHGGELSLFCGNFKGCAVANSKILAILKHNTVEEGTRRCRPPATLRQDGFGMRETQKNRTNFKQTKALLPERSALNALLQGAIGDPHSILGLHPDGTEGSLILRVYDPMADQVFVLENGKRTELLRILPEGLFALGFPGRKQGFAYELEKVYPDSVSVAADPYCFLPGLGEMDLYLFNQGEHHKVYDVMGAHVRCYDGVSGVDFAVWAPNARRVSVVGDFNCWDGRRHPMRMLGASGIWELFIPGMRAGDIYKYEIKTQSGDVFTKLDPYAQRTELRPHTAGVVPDPEPFEWTDASWMERRAQADPQKSPMNIYEVHLGSWGGPGLPPLSAGQEFPNYRDLAHALGAYAAEMGYTHIELLPICEHPLDQSWGYQVTGFYAPTARYGSPEDFAYFVDYMHSLGIGVIMDWVPAHFPKDSFSLGRFDGTALYEHADPRQGEHRDWGTYIFNYGRTEVRSFLIGSALYWMDRFHVDGLRVDAVASMLYLDYSREPGQWIPNRYGGNENLEAIAFLKHLNELTHQLFKGTVMIAEESTAWPGVSRPVYLGGLGFTFKWNMGWMHDTLEYFALDPIYRSYNHGKLTFSLLYAFSENFVLPLSHDEVVHGKKSIIGRMPGDYQQKFANLRALYSYMLTHPGKKLLFMGGEIAQMTEWNCNQALDWNLLDFPMHRQFREMMRELNHFYRSAPALWEDDFTQNGFQWIDGGDYRQSIISYIRWDREHRDPLVVIVNLTPVVRDNFTLGVPFPGTWNEVFNSDDSAYGGTGQLNSAPLSAEPGLYHGQAQHLTLRLPWLGAVILRHSSSS